MRIRTLVVTAATLMALLSTASPAGACPMPRKMQNTMMVASQMSTAQQALDQKDWEKALITARKMLGSEDPFLSAISPLTPYMRKKANRIAGIAAFHLGQFPMAEDHLSRATEDPEVREFRAASLVEMDRHAEAGLVLQPLLENRALSAAGQVTLARVEMHANNRIAAWHALHQALTAEPQNVQALALKAEFERSRHCPGPRMLSGSYARVLAR